MPDETPGPDGHDYGERNQSGQYESHPTVDEGEFVQPVRRTYIHTECGGRTKMAVTLAESVARDPTFYSHTFCADCRDYYPVSEFEWPDGSPWATPGGGDDGDE